MPKKSVLWTRIQRYETMPRLLLSDPNVTSASKCVWTYLFGMSQTYGVVFPTHETIAKQCGISKNSSMRAVRELEEHGYLNVIRQKGGTGNKNVYEVTLPLGRLQLWEDATPDVLAAETVQPTDQNPKSHSETSEPQIPKSHSETVVVPSPIYPSSTIPAASSDEPVPGPSDPAAASSASKEGPPGASPTDSAFSKPKTPKSPNPMHRSVINAWQRKFPGYVVQPKDHKAVSNLIKTFPEKDDLSMYMRGYFEWRDSPKGGAWRTSAPSLHEAYAAMNDVYHWANGQKEPQEAKKPGPDPTDGMYPDMSDTFNKIYGGVDPKMPEGWINPAPKPGEMNPDPEKG